MQAATGGKLWIHLQGWTLTADVITELSGLPQWCASLGLTGCTWPPQPGVCSALPAIVPGCYRQWYLFGAPEQHVQASMNGFAQLPQTAGQPGSPVQLNVGEVPGLDAMRQHVEESNLVDRVVMVTGGLPVWCERGIM